MRTSLNETKKIEDYLYSNNNGEIADKLLFQANMIIDSDLREKVLLQQQVYKLVRMSGRKKLKAEIETVHQKLFLDTGHNYFRNSILKLFNTRK